MHPDSTPKTEATLPPKPLTGQQRQQQRLEKGLPRFTEAEQRSRKRRARRKSEERYQVRRALVDAVKLERGCADCGYREHACALQFDHRPGEVKVASLSAMCLNTPLEVIEAEIAKCDVVCANCHSIRTVARRREKRRQQAEASAADRQSQPPGVKLTDDQVKEMLYAFLANPTPARLLAEQYGVCRTTISEILLGRSRREVEPAIRPQVRGTTLQLAYPSRKGIPHKLTHLNDVRAIRARFAAGEMTRSELAREYGVSLSAVCAIIAGKTWSHVK